MVILQTGSLRMATYKPLCWIIIYVAKRQDDDDSYAIAYSPNPNSPSRHC